jgi:hypothetical protein
MLVCATWLARDYLRRAGRPLDIPPCDHSPDDCPPIREGANDMTTAADTRDIAIEVAAIAMRNATDRAAVGLSMRARRDLAALAYDAILRTIATNLRAEGDRLQKVHEQTGNVLGFSHALSFGDAATWLLSSRATPEPAAS